MILPETQLAELARQVPVGDRLLPAVGGRGRGNGRARRLVGVGTLDVDFADDDLVLYGFLLGGVLGLVSARAVRGRRTVHRVLVGVGILLVVVGTADVMVKFWLPADQPGELYAGLSRALAGRFAIGVAVLGALWVLAGWSGLQASRLFPSAHPADAPEAHDAEAPPHEPHGLANDRRRPENP